MKENILKIVLVVVVLVLGIGLFVFKNSSVNKAGLEFKEEYESINGEKNSSGKVHRTVTIDKDNPYEKTTAEEIVKKIENKETFYLYVGDKLCPWCRSVIEKSIEVAKEKNINKIYYVNIWDDEGNEILRDRYTVEDEELVKTVDGTKAYYKLLKYFDKVLSQYKVTDEDNNEYDTGEKRIYAPNYFYVKDGKVVRMTEGISEKQTDSREELTKEILKDEEKLFNEFFK